MQNENPTKNFKACLLIAGPGLQDPNFSRSVVLLIERDGNGAMGFILNKPTELFLDQVVPENSQIPADVRVWDAGPVDSSTGFVLHAHKREGDGATVCGSAWLSWELSSIPTKSELVDGGNKLLYPYRFLLGYSGWSPKQLDEEIRHGAWLEVDYSEELVFDTPVEEIWEKAMAKLGIHSLENLAMMDNPYLS